MTRAGLSATRAAVQGVGLAARAPGLLLVIVIVTVLTAIPFAIAVDSTVMASLAVQPPASAIGGTEIDPEWWLEFRRHATGVAASFTPAILGFAAPLDSISSLLDGKRPPMALLVPIAASALIWAFLWGGVVHRFVHGDTSARGFVSAGGRHYGSMLAITLTAAVTNVLIYLSVHAVLLKIVYDAIAARVPAERDAFLARVVLYIVFGAVLASINAIFAFARIHVVADHEPGVAAAVSRGWTFVRAHLTAVAALYLAFVVVFALVLTAYGAMELLGGARVGGWRAIVIGQAFIVFRLALRLALTASQVRLAAQAGG